MACAVGEVANKVEGKKWFNPTKFFRNIGLASIEGGKRALKYGYDASRDMDFRQNVLPSFYYENYEEALNKFIKDHPGFTTPEDLKRYVEDFLKKVTPGDFDNFKDKLDSVYDKLDYDSACGATNEDTFIDDLTDSENRAENARIPVDPVVIDLNGNGISKKTTKEGVYFDLNSDGFIEKTEWIENEDGFLVRDLNNDGIINNRTELIGDKQLLSNGELSKNGLEVLQDLDKNKDGYLDENDEAFSTLKVWKDANGNGVTDEGELYTLQELGIKKLELQSSVNKDLTIGNVEFTDGTKNIMSDLEFNVNLVDSLFNEFELDENDYNDEYGFAYVTRTGKVTNLAYAISKDDKLKEIVNDIIENPSADVYKKIDNLLLRWTGSEDIDANSRGTNINARYLGVVEAFTGRQFIGVDGVNPNSQATPILNEMYEYIRNRIFSEVVMCAYSSYIMETGYFDYDSNKFINYDGSETTNEQYSKIALLLKAQSNYYLASDKDKETINEISEILKKESDIFKDIYNINYINKISNSSINGTEQDDYIVANSGNDNINSGSGNDIVYGGEGNDKIYGQDGNDKLYGGEGNDSLYGGNGDDYLDGGAGDDYLEGGAGDDTFVYGKGYGNDVVTKDWYSTQEQGTLIMKDLNKEDIEYGAKGNDLILKIKETNETVTIKDYLYRNNYKMGKIEFEDGTVLFEDVVNTIKENPVLIEGTENNDYINYSGSASNWMRVNVKAGSGNDTIYTGIEDDYIEGGAGDDYINSGSGNDEIYGEEGNDKLYGGEGNDKLYGGEGNDSLYGGNGDDYLDGGAGDDYLEGGYGNDTYVYNKGDGNDTISDYSTVAGEIDKLILNDINSSDVSLSKEGYNLVVSINGTEDKITINDHYYSSNYRLENIMFADGVNVSCDNTGSFDIDGAVAMLKQTYCLTSEDEAIINTSNINTETNTDDSSFVAFLNTNQQ
jgi:Ca2+-binding RTX toxin-like protein